MTDANEGNTASVVVRALADMKSAEAAWDDAVGALEAAVRRGATWDECLPLFAAARNAEVGWRDESVEAVARVVGASLLETGHADVWRALFVLLLAKFDIWTGWNAGYDLGDEAAFVAEAGWWERDKGVRGEGAE